MKYLLRFILFVCVSNSLSANDRSYDWVLEQYGNNETSEIEAHANGEIGGVKYIAIIARRTSPANNDGPAVLVFKKTANRPTIIAKIDLQGDYAAGYSVAIRNGSIYLEHWVGHHGWHGRRYQFKQTDHGFRMIGAEHQSQQLGCYAGDDSPTCSEREVWSGASYNFPMASAICWQETINQRRERRIKEMSRRSEKWLQPKSGVRHQMTFRPINPPSLDGFDFLEFSLPKACYFDHKNRLQLER
ncbi:MAG TPA: hypothetical protein VI457_00635 [Methylococcaceae bacterium]|nr:hypothetical protein [Methylococcaceae bacterium]